MKSSHPGTAILDGLPCPARAFVRRSQPLDNGTVKAFGGFALAIACEPVEDAVYEVEITFIRKLSEGPACHGRRLDQVMTGPVLTNPELLEGKGP